MLISSLPYHPLVKDFSLSGESSEHRSNLSSDEVVSHGVAKCPSIGKLLGKAVMKVRIAFALNSLDFIFFLFLINLF